MFLFWGPLTKHRFFPQLLFFFIFFGRPKKFKKKPAILKEKKRYFVRGPQTKPCCQFIFLGTPRKISPFFKTCLFFSWIFFFQGATPQHTPTPSPGPGPGPGPGQGPGQGPAWEAWPLGAMPGPGPGPGQGPAWEAWHPWGPLGAQVGSSWCLLRTSRGPPSRGPSCWLLACLVGGFGVVLQ